MSDIKAKLTEDMKSAMRAKEKQTLATIRSILAAIKQKEIDERISVSDEQVLAILNKLAKQRQESIAQYDKAQRADLSEIEQFELAIIRQYLPEQLSSDAIDSHIRAVLEETGAKGPQDMGKMMGILKPRLNGKADMGLVSRRVKQHLSDSV